jgi:hypothetical protein
MVRQKEVGKLRLGTQAVVFGLATLYFTQFTAKLTPITTLPVDELTFRRCLAVQLLTSPPASRYK